MCVCVSVCVCVCAHVRVLYIDFLITREDSRVQRLFTRHLLDDRTDSSMSYYEFLLHVQRQLTK